MPPASPTVLARGKHAEVLAWGEHHVLKLFRPGHGRSAIAEELRQAQLAHALGIPTARAEKIIEHQGRAGIVFERLQGPTLFHLALTRAEPVERLAALLWDLGRAIHRCAVAGIPAIEARLAARIARAQGVPDRARHAALEALHRVPGGKTLCHGDLHPMNVIVTERGPCVLDWVDAAQGPAAADAARTLLLLELARPAQIEPAMRAAFVGAYRERLAAGGQMELIAPWALPVAVARLVDGVDAAERAVLLERIALLVG
jgi:Ser/Thr protein kinase RdoA (MazF antagonist)